MSTLSPPSADALRSTLPGLADQIVAAIAEEVPDYARPMEGRFGETVRFGVQVALNRFVDLLVGQGPRHARDTYRQLGAGEYKQGRTLDALLSAYRVGARVAWRRFVDAGTQAGFPADALYDLGEAMFVYIDEISAESAAGFAEAQSEAAGETQRRRRRLLRLLVQEPAADTEAVRTAATAAGWALPRVLAAVVAAEADQPEGLAAARGAPGASEELLDGIAARLARRLGPGAVGAAVGGLAVVLMPDPDGPGRRKALEAALHGDLGAIGPAVAWPEAAGSLRRAEAAFRLAAQGRLDVQNRTSPSEQGLIVADEHLPALLLAAAPGISADLARTRLAPLDGLADGPRERLAITLRAYLDRPGQVQAIASALDVHPQTVRYRLKQLRELFGERLEDPEARFELSLALRAAEGLRY
ncbi:PucR family transcriptional regulator [Solirubrobacter soli]|uniref:PucR family transcriptional regulator n=1 Tax=Solirubrobacter soli TaxID=363832 RepID=UPI00042A2FCA|nr:helix-turn-helix domain-containing protein [Solirubrobacter soli]